jgi:hypothetical protein
MTDRGVLRLREARLKGVNNAADAITELNNRFKERLTFGHRLKIAKVISR